MKRPYGEKKFWAAAKSLLLPLTTRERFQAIRWRYARDASFAIAAFWNHEVTLNLSGGAALLVLHNSATLEWAGDANLRNPEHHELAGKWLAWAFAAHNPGVDDEKGSAK